MSAGSEESVSVFVFAIVLASAFTHASWNLAARKVKGQLSVFVGGLVVATVCLTPFAFAISAGTMPPVDGLPQLWIWPFVVSAANAEVFRHSFAVRLLEAESTDGKLDI